MIFLPLALALLSFVEASRIHKLKLHKLTPTTSNPEFESAYLAEKYGASSSQPQMPLLGVGGTGRRVVKQNGEQLFWTQEELKGGHSVPLSSS